MQEKLIEIFKQTKVILEHRGWCKRWTALDKEGRFCAWNAAGAASFDIIGAIFRAAMELDLNHLADSAIIRFNNANGGICATSTWNDNIPSTEPTKVLEALDKAIQFTKGNEVHEGEGMGSETSSGNDTGGAKTAVPERDTVAAESPQQPIQRRIVRRVTRTEAEVGSSLQAVPNN